MATITKSIGFVSRDYSSIGAWEADLDTGAIYASGDDAVGECYDDAAFNEVVTMNGGNTIGLNSVRLTAATGHRHDGTAGTGVRIVRFSSVTPVIALNVPATSFSGKYTVEWFELDLNGQAIIGFSTSSAVSGAVPVIRYCLVHDSTDTPGFMTASSRDALVHNCIFYDTTRNGTSVYGIHIDGDQAAGGFLNNTVYKVANTSTGTGGTVGGVRLSSAVAATHVRNNVMLDVSYSGTSPTLMACWEFLGGTGTGTFGNNASSDTSATGGSGNVTDVVAADTFVSTTNGSEDLHLKTGASLINAGADLGTTPTGVNIDIDGRDRDAENDTWDIGADEFVSQAIGTGLLAFASQVVSLGFRILMPDEL